MIKIKNIFKLSIILILILSFIGCSQDNNIDKNQGIQENEDIKKNEVNQKDDNVIKNEIQSISEIVNTLCSDDFGGRLVGSEGNYKTEEYINSILQSLELEPLLSNEFYHGYTQDVLKTLNLHGDNGKPESKEVHNLVGVIRGSDSQKATIISAHFDHIGYQDGKIIRGALDNASGVAALIKLANILKEKSLDKAFSQDIIFAFFNGEEVGLRGSKRFVNEIKDKYSSLYNINIDCVGGKRAGKITLSNTSKVSDRLTEAMKKSFKNNNFVFSENKEASEISDQRSFEEKKIPNIYIRQENIKPYIHNETDIPESLDYSQIEEVSKILSKFIEENDGIVFDK